MDRGDNSSALALRRRLTRFSETVAEPVDKGCDSDSPCWRERRGGRNTPG
jgi:hypothetical protein